MRLSPEQLLRKVVSIDSVFPKEATLAHFISLYLKSNGFKVGLQRIEKGRFNILAEKGEGEAALLFYAHLDTVPPYGSWKSNPFKPKVIGDRLYGLGCCDMKGGLCAIISAATSTEGRVKLLLCSDEENISKGAWKAVGAKRNWFKGVRIAVSGEPGASSKGIGGTDMVTVGRRGRAVFNIDVLGESSHGAQPKKGLSAIDQASRLITSLGTLQMMRHKIGKESLFVRRFESASTSVSVPDKAHLELDMHTVPPTTAASARKRIITWANKLKKEGRVDPRVKIKVSLKLRQTPYAMPYCDDLEDKPVRKMIGLIGKGNLAPRLNYGSSVADDNVLSAQLGIPVIAIGPRGGRIHSSDEWVSLSSYRKLIAIYVKMIESF